MGIRVPSLLFVAGWHLVENKVRVHTLLFVAGRTSSGDQVRVHPRDPSEISGQLIVRRLFVLHRFA